MNTESVRSAHPDLEALRRTESAATAPRRPWLPRLTALVLVLGLLGAAYAVLQPVLFPPQAVRVSAVRAVTDGAGTTRAAGTVTAAGWIEAYPFPVTVRPLVQGVVAEIRILEGTPVVEDETVLATLRNIDIENALTLAQAELALQDSVRAKAVTAHAVAKTLLEQKIPLRMLVAEHAGELATARAAVARAEAARLAEVAALATARVDLDAQRKLQEAGQATPTALARAQARVSEAESRVVEFRLAEVLAQAEVQRHVDLLALANEAREDPRALRGAVDEAAAELAHAQAAYARAKTDLEVAERNAALLTIKAPMNGVVLRLESAPGAVVGPQGDFKGAGEGAGSTGLLNRLTGAVCSLYDPQQLQVRVDVPFADLPGIAKGTAVELEAKSLPGRRFRGTVDRLVREADITQAKLQVKVRIEDPDEALRPEMLCTTRFVVEASEPSARGGTPTTRMIEVPTAAVRGDAVFVYDPTRGGRARRVPVRVLRRGDEWTAVEGDVGLATKVILDEVEDGKPVKVTR